MNNILLLASQSRSRRMLLAQMKVPFVLLDQQANEKECDWQLPLTTLVESIAKHKMSQILLHKGIEGQKIFVLTADTLTQDHQGNMLGKPDNKEHAYAMLRQVRQGACVATAFCLDKKVWKFDTWQTEQRMCTVVEGHCIFDVPDHWFERYINNSLALYASGSITIEGYGAQFLQSVHGSYSTIMGLPVFELREALESIGFF